MIKLETDAVLLDYVVRYLTAPERRNLPNAEVQRLVVASLYQMTASRKVTHNYDKCRDVHVLQATSKLRRYWSSKFSGEGAEAANSDDEFVIDLPYALWPAPAH